MKLKMLSLFAVTMIALSIFGAKASMTQSDLNLFAKELNLEFHWRKNQIEGECDKNRASGNCYFAEIKLLMPKDYSESNWIIYFSHVNPIQKDISERFDITHINGDLHSLKPTKYFRGFEKDKPILIGFYTDFWSVSRYDIMPNFYLTLTGLQPEVIHSTIPTINPETGIEELNFVKGYNFHSPFFNREKGELTQAATPEVNYIRNAKFSNKINDVSTEILPKPKSIQVVGNAHILLESGFQIKSSDFDVKQFRGAFKRLEKLGFKPKNKGVALFIKKNPRINNAEGYQLNVGTDAIIIESKLSKGVFYALQSLSGLININAIAIPEVSIIDEPLFEFRGVHIDLARNFHSKEFLFKLIEQMGAYKLNRLHLHLADDEGWRLAISGLPELTELGTKRCHDIQEQRCLLPQLGAGPYVNNEGNGVYNEQDYIDILQLANEHFIEVIPSLDMPGHSRASVKAMEYRYQRLMAENKEEEAKQYLLTDFDDKTVYESVQYYNDNTINVCLPSSYAFFEKVITEVQSLHKKANHPLNTFHIGADETPGAWTDSPQCKDYVAKNKLEAEKLGSHFVEKVSKLLSSKGIQAAGWSDGLILTDTEKMPKNVQANAWGLLGWDGHKQAHTLVNRGWDVILSIPDVTYFDFPYIADPNERGYYWGSRETDTLKVFQFMPENLPVHAEFWTDRMGKPMTLDDRANEKESYIPMKEGKRFKGIQAQLWSETIRSDRQVESMMFPRLLALAERAWSKAEWSVDYDYKGREYSSSSQYFSNELRNKMSKDWLRFRSLLVEKELPKLEAADIEYRLPVVGAVWNGAHWEINLPLPGLPLEYLDDENGWQSIHVEALKRPEIQVRTRTFDGKRAGRTQKLKAKLR